MNSDDAVDSLIAWQQKAREDRLLPKTGDLALFANRWLCFSLGNDGNTYYFCFLTEEHFSVSSYAENRGFFEIDRSRLLGSSFSVISRMEDSL